MRYTLQPTTQRRTRLAFWASLGIGWVMLGVWQFSDAHTGFAVLFVVVAILWFALGVGEFLSAREGRQAS